MPTAAKRRQRGRNLDEEAISQILGIIDGFSGRMTYAMLIDEIELRLKSRYTRQALFRHERIRRAFESKKNAPAPRNTSRALSPAKQIEAQSLARLKSENARLTAENDALIQKFTRWAYNAFTRGLDEAFLDRPLPPIDRGKAPGN